MASYANVWQICICCSIKCFQCVAVGNTDILPSVIGHSTLNMVFLFLHLQMYMAHSLSIVITGKSLKLQNIKPCKCVYL